MFSRWKRASESVELDLIPVMNLFMVLIPFLLMGATFLHVAVIPTSIATLGAGEEPEAPSEIAVRLNIQVTSNELRLTGAATGLSEEATQALARTFPLAEGYRLQGDDFQSHLVQIKTRYPRSTDVLVVCDNAVPYQSLIRILDAAREVEVGRRPDGEPDYRELFPAVTFTQLLTQEASP